MQMQRNISNSVLIKEEYLLEDEIKQEETDCNVASYAYLLLEHNYCHFNFNQQSAQASSFNTCQVNARESRNQFQPGKAIKEEVLIVDVEIKQEPKSEPCEGNSTGVCVQTETFIPTPRKHLKRNSHRTNQDQPGALLQCGSCKQTFCSRNKLNSHGCCHRGVKTYNTDVLNYFNKSYRCDICGKMFARMYELTVHVRTGHEPYKCDVCRETFLTNTALNHHARIHKRDKPYKCLLCKKTFLTLTILADHYQLIHTECKPAGKPLT